MTALLISVLVLVVISVALNILVLGTLGEMLTRMKKGVAERERTRQIAGSAIAAAIAASRESMMRVPGSQHYDA